MAESSSSRAYSGRNYQNKGKFKAKVGQKWKQKSDQEHRERTVMREYRKMLKKEKQQITRNNDESNVKQREIQRINKKIKKSALERAHEVYKMKQEEKQEKREEIERIRQEKETALKKYQENKMRKMRILRQKTKKGQPVMKGRIELLLEKIERQAKIN